MLPVPDAPAVVAVLDAALADVFMALTAATVAAAPKAAERTVRREMPLETLAETAFACVIVLTSLISVARASIRRKRWLN
ncbi:hypothetical protein BTE77_30540 [Ensifer adhaerens]|nr:hypothetical protein BTE77_30540 [Ensifer adhaerens]